MSLEREQLNETFSKVKLFIESKINQYQEIGVPEDIATKYAVEEMTMLFQDASENNGVNMEKIQENYDVLLSQLRKEKNWRSRSQDYLPKDVAKPENLSPYEWKEYVKDRLLKGDIWSFVQYWLAQKNIDFPEAPRPDLNPSEVKKALDKRNPGALKIIWRALAQLGLGVLATSALASMVIFYRKAKKERREALERNMEKDPKAFIIRVVNPSQSSTLEKRTWSIIGNVLGDDKLRYQSMDDGETSKIMLLYLKPVTREILEKMQSAIVEALAEKQFATLASANPRHIKKVGQVPLLEIHVHPPRVSSETQQRSANRSSNVPQPISASKKSVSKSASKTRSSNKRKRSRESKKTDS